MKNQYFGDRNDMFKYDLALTLVAEVDALRGFTFVPMLTPEDGRADGNKTNYPALARHRPHLHRFLMDCVAEPSRRKVTSLKDYMREHESGIPYHPHMDADFLTDANRDTYFSSIRSEALKTSVILVDPDNGFEVGARSMAGDRVHKYFKYAELADLYRRMDDTSVLLAYQHWSYYVKREVAFSAVAERIRAALPDGLPPMCISSGDIGFFVLAKAEGTHSGVRDALEGYAAKTGFTLYPRREEPLLFTMEGIR
jgi:hypothetical protein